MNDVHIAAGKKIKIALLLRRCQWKPTPPSNAVSWKRNATHGREIDVTSKSVDGQINVYLNDEAFGHLHSAPHLYYNARLSLRGRLPGIHRRS